ncbi:MAG: lamin tail domain-containing protein, partial [Planctomycetes bacterium]|nr:lamin tail domain-containing protein [Planctomycetota bacterium]
MMRQLKWRPTVAHGIVLFLGLVLSTSTQAQVVINEILADPDAALGDANGDGTSSTTQDEFVEIYNSSGAALDVSGWELHDAVAVRHVFPAGTTIPADCGVVVFAGGTPTGTFGDALVQVASTGSLGLNNGGDTVSIFDAGLTLVTEVIYGAEGGNNQSITRSPDVTGTFVEHSTVGTGALFSPGTFLDGTRFPGCGVVVLPNVVINEILADPDAALGDANGDGTVSTTDDEFVEIFNASGADLDVGSWELHDLTGVRHVFPSGTLIAADCSVVIFAGGAPTGTFGDALVQVASTGALGLNNGGDTVRLFDASANLIAEVVYGAEGGNNQSITRSPDVTGTFVEHSTVGTGALFSPGTQLDGVSFAGCQGVVITPNVIINEFLADPDAATGDANGDGVVDTSADEFVELVNDSGADLDVGGWELHDLTGVRHVFPAGTVIAADCAIVVFGGGTPTGIFGGAEAQVASTGSLGLNNGGDTISLFDATLTLVAEVVYGAEAGDNQSITLDPDLTGVYTPHTLATTSGGTAFSPGTLADGSNFTGCTPPQCVAPNVTGIVSDCETGDITLMWDNGSTYSQLIVVRDGTDLATLSGTDTSYIDSGVAPGIYEYLIVGVCDFGGQELASLTFNQCPDVVINEIRIDQPNADDDEYFELAAAPGTSLDGITYLVIGDGTGGSGVIESEVDLTGSTVGASGLFFAAKDADTFGAVADLVTTFNFENGDNVTHLLVTGYVGASGLDLDTDDDGVLDILPWATIVDLIALIEEDNPPTATEFHYGPPVVGPDDAFVPGHAKRCPDVTGDFVVGAFDPVGGSDTPGAPNACCDPVIVTEVTADVTSGNAPLTVTFGATVAGTDPIVFSWDFDGDTIEDSSDPAPSFEFTAAGVYDVVLSASNDCGTATGTIQITVCEPLSVGFDASPTFGVAPLCVDFSDQTTGDIAGYTWDFGNGTQSNDANPTGIQYGAGTYDVTLTVDGSCGRVEMLTQSALITAIAVG